MSKISEKLSELVLGRDNVPDEFWVDGCFWFHDDSSGGYEWDSERLGIDRSGNVVWAFDSGCSCYGPWERFDPKNCDTVSHKQFVLEKFNSSRGEYSSMEAYDEARMEKELDEWLMLVREDVEPKQVLTAENSEIRRYLIKRIGYEKIKDAVNAKVLHRDGESELLMFSTGEMYVKVKDSSTDREYLLFVEGNHKTCRSAIAWTFGLREEDYKPEIET